MDQVKRQSSAAKPSSFLSRTLTRRDTGRDDADDSKGPLGLTTLYDPPVSAIADVIFVHGLGGGSRSTWTSLNDLSSYWPQAWLPNDISFRDVRIHSFGYDSNWAKESTLTLHDFAKSLLGSLQDCPLMPRTSKTPVILIGHSMGGLVIKRAYILARQKGEFQTLAERVTTMFFLATPHRGANLAELLSKVLNLTSGPRPYVADLHRNSFATQSINDEFPQYCQDLQLYSFYETIPMNYGLGKGLVVDKDLATLGYANERTAYLNANHREVCKFSTQAEPNYQTIRNALASAIDSLRSVTAGSARVIDNEQRHLLDIYLGVSDAPENDFMDIDTVRMSGSCDWLVQKDTFKLWQNSTNTQMYWISAKPANGKTVLTGRVINYLKGLNLDPKFFLFDYRDREKTAISSFLLSMAWQMANKDTEVFNNLLEICEKDHEIGRADYRTIWRKLFVEGLLRTKFLRPQYWVIDALDECKPDDALIPLLLKIIEVSPIHIFLTSRNRFDAQRHKVRPEVKIISEEIDQEDTKSDIALYLEANITQLPMIDEEARRNMIAKILEKSAGCFLWVSLTLQELRGVHTSAEIRQVLEDVPSDMDELYSRILDSMSRATYGKRLAKTILTWVVCSVRPPTTEELHHALQIGLKDSVDSIERSIESSCGHLVYVDTQSRVQMVHQTARDYLLRASDKIEFAIDARAGHKDIAMACLQYLNSSEMKAPKHRRLSATSVAKQRSPFVAYASNHFFEHVRFVSSIDDDILYAVVKFLRSSNVLSWIEYVAQHSSLNRLIQAGKVIKNFLQRRSNHLSPLGKEISYLDSWAVDIVRLVTKFGKNLLSYPSSIFQLIPPFCPPQTAPYKQFATTARGISVLGLSATGWDDCLSTIANPHERFSALACSNEYFAIGTSNGTIALYNETTCQEVRTLKHGEPVKILQFGKRIGALASAGLRKIRIWNTYSWEQSWEFDLTTMCLSISFMDEEQLLLGALKDNHLVIWDLASGTLRELADWTIDLDDPIAHAYRRPITAAFCMESRLLAVIYRGQDILLWDLERDCLHDTYCKESGVRVPGAKRNTTAGVMCIMFSLAPNNSLLAASYSDGDLVLFDTSEGIVEETTLANAQILASSPDGRTLATGNSSGTIQLFDFETLKLIYTINSGDFSIKELAFSEDSQRLIEIAGSQCRVWDPTVLVRQDLDDENSDTVSVSTVPQEFSLDSSEDVPMITSLACGQSSDMFFCGKDNGLVLLHEVKPTLQSQRLFSHADGVAILALHFEDRNQILCSTDSSSRVMAHRIVRGQKSWEVELLLDHRTGTAVSQVLCNSAATRMLISTTNQDALWSIENDQHMVIEELLWQDRTSYRWATHPTRQGELILIMNYVAHLYDWKTLKKLTSDGGILLEGSIIPELIIRSTMPCFEGSMLSTTFSESRRPNPETTLLLWNASDFDLRSKSSAPIPKYHSLANHVKNIVGEYGQRLVFLHSNGWICSVGLQSSSVGNFDRHFFLPADWLSSSSDLLFGLLPRGDIIFVKRDEVAVIKRGLDSSEPEFDLAGKRPSLLGRYRASLPTSDVGMSLH
ncbi:MAG: hypothetical protein M1820_005291 [Bogoriella megaspora]|nr:MAG: hypothetical protein M1820_005291 [Bogoriella megaspora]